MEQLVLILLIIIIIIVLYYNSTINNICYKEPEYFEYSGKEKGPAILIVGATHGNEPAGYYSIKEYMNKLNKQELVLKKGKTSCSIILYIKYIFQKIDLYNK